MPRPLPAELRHVVKAVAGDCHEQAIVFMPIAQRQRSMSANRLDRVTIRYGGNIAAQDYILNKLGSVIAI